MAALPQIKCNGYTFTPRGPVSDVYYGIGLPIKPDLSIEDNPCTVYTTNKTDQKTITHLIVPILPINADLKAMQSSETTIKTSTLAGLIFTGVAIYFLGSKRNFNFGVVSAASALVFGISVWHNNKQRKRASFDVANKVITTFRKEIDLAFNPSDYKV